ncbi:hypothetical protein PSECIP111951_00921 [Pseudoalteromonas holothuriae]|uniref:Uncharacterized protein n=1 Tax=Pseudoalteromonas holothuriae TaxID=2963714 RepID=A0A9W4VY86_9GAMM|nr:MULTISPECIES: hypothetical protein [unclassified Pseudoalteromonas]CAH9053921.1 hypothetical protein PSECIP111951_00921 [Pseudoalteromonas sp. CIP111951]CAH9055697.1 hypothetical protein PSECIP111854_01630 [Pseudoalteromonas sp. CIP111854]
MSNTLCGCDTATNEQAVFNPSFQHLKVFINGYTVGSEDECGDDTYGKLELAIKTCASDDLVKVVTVKLQDVICTENLPTIQSYLKQTLVNDAFDPTYQLSTAFVNGAMYQTATDKLAFKISELYQLVLKNS